MRIERSHTLQSAKYLQKKRKKNIITIVLYIVCILSFLIAIIFFFRLPFFQISIIEITGNTSSNTDEIKQKILDDMNGNYLFFIPKSNFIFYPKTNIIQDLISSYKNIDKVNIHWKSLSAIEVNIIDRIPDAVFCDGFQNEENSKCYFTDNNGYIFKQSPVFSDGVYTKYYINSDSTNMDIGNSFIDSNKLKDLQKFVQGVKNVGITVTGILIAEAGSYELYFKNNDKSDAIIYFDDRTSFDKTLSNFITFWQNSLNKNFNYINLRFGNNIFFIVK